MLFRSLASLCSKLMPFRDSIIIRLDFMLDQHIFLKPDLKAIKIFELESRRFSSAFVRRNNTNVSKYVPDFGGIRKSNGTRGFWSTLQSECWLRVSSGPWFCRTDRDQTTIVIFFPTTACHHRTPLRKFCLTYEPHNTKKKRI